MPEQKEDRPEWAVVSAFAALQAAQEEARRVAFDDWRTVLDFEGKHRTENGAKLKLIDEIFGVRPVRYYQRLNRIIDMPEALAHDPHLIYGLRDARTRRMAERTGVLS